ncbi:MAG: methionyl-tRNA formyltransferase [Thermodesulfobacteriota bacterium]|nr:methionyl-tRNA formyltransferase [Thermodesulfobacteriota bacterium]
MKLLFLGASEFAVPSLKSLIGSPHEVLAVITQPDRPKGRGRKLVPSAIKSLTLDKNIPLFQPEKISDSSSLKALRSFQPELIVVVAYGQILPPTVLSIPPRGCVNVHASLLPKYRGAAPINWAILNGETRTGVTTMYMDAGMDTGPLLLSAETLIEMEDTAGTLHDRLSRMGAQLLLETLDGLEKDLIIPRPQDPSLATYAPKINKDTTQINWNTPARQLANFLRAFDPWPGAFTYWDGRLLKLFRPRYVEEPEENPLEAPGTIVRADADELCIATSPGYLRVRELQMENRPRMSVSEFLRGHPLKTGVRLGA